MPTDIASLGIEEQTAVVNGPAAGDPRTAASVTGMGQPLVNRSLWAWRRIQELAGAFAPLGGATPLPISSIDQAMDTITLAAHGLSNGTPVRFLSSAGGSPPAPLDEQTLYYVVGAMTNTIQVSLTSGGAAINLTGPIAGSVYLVMVTHPGLWLPTHGSMLGGAIGDVLQQFGLLNGVNVWMQDNLFGVGTTTVIQGTTWMSGQIIVLGDDARMTWRPGKLITDAPTTLDVWNDTYICPTPTAQRTHTIRTSTSPVPLPGQRMLVKRPGTGAFAIILQREGSVAAICTLAASTTCSAELEFYSGQWRLRMGSDGVTPGADAD